MLTNRLNLPHSIKEVEGFPGYFVSNKGEVFSTRKSKNSLRPLKQQIDARFGYLRVIIYTNRKPKNLSVHRLVAAAFCGPANGRRCVNHINFIKTDNRASNLEWVTHLDNTLHSKRAGRIKPFALRNKVTREQVAQIRALLAAGERQHVIAEQFGLTQPMVSMIKHERCWK